MIPVTTFAGKAVAVFGLGASGTATALALMAGGARVAAWDDGAAGRASAETAGVPVVDLSTADFDAFSALVLAPGVPLTHPQPHWTVLKAQAAGIEIIGDIELFCRERNAITGGVHNLAPFIAITGTNGKSTTTALIAHILRAAGKDVQMGGNIGVPVLALEPPAKDRFHVIEISSFQIDLTPSLNPLVGVLLNITPDHLDRHGTLWNYASIKARLIDQSVLQVVGTGAARMLADIADAEQRPASFDAGDLISGSQEAPVHVAGGLLKRRVIEGGQAVFKTIADLNGVATLRGAHNGENAAAAYAALETFLPPDVIAAHMLTYPGLPHRMEEIGRVGPVLFINDSKATNADSTEKALLSFPRDVYWIVGGKAKDGGIAELRPYFPGIVKAYLIGASSDAFAATLEGAVAYERCGTLEVAVARAAADAALSGGRQPVVLLSPACASYDQFRSFEHRGDVFRGLVAALTGFTARTSS